MTVFAVRTLMPVRVVVLVCVFMLFTSFLSYRFAETQFRIKRSVIDLRKSQ